MMRSMKIIKLHTGEEREIPTFKCKICEGNFTEVEGGVCNGVIGMIPVAFCPTCFNGLLEMGDYFRSSYIDRGTDDED